MYIKLVISDYRLHLHKKFPKQILFTFKSIKSISLIINIEVQEPSENLRICILFMKFRCELEVKSEFELVV